MTIDDDPRHLTLGQLSSPVGTIHFATDEGEALRALIFGDDQALIADLLRRRYGTVPTSPTAEPGPIGRALQRYFDGDLSAITGVRTASSGTPFQCSVWAALSEIPAGTTVSYGAIATKIGRPNAVRAVGMANGANPIGLVVPCHRVIGADGTLTGYGGGIERKRWLLAHEGVAVSSTKFVTMALIP